MTSIIQHVVRVIPCAAVSFRNEGIYRGAKTISLFITTWLTIHASAVPESE